MDSLAWTSNVSLSSVDLDKIWRRIRYLFTLLVVNLIFLYWSADKISLCFNSSKDLPLFWLAAIHSIICKSLRPPGLSLIFGSSWYAESLYLRCRIACSAIFSLKNFSILIVLLIVVLNFKKRSWLPNIRRASSRLVAVDISAINSSLTSARFLTLWPIFKPISQHFVMNWLIFSSFSILFLLLSTSMSTSE